MRGLFLALALAAPLCFLSRPAHAEDGDTVQIPTAAEQLFALANQTRAQAGAGRLAWDSALAAAALNHCKRMAAEGPISHRYNGEADLASRAGQAGAHFQLIEENVAVGPTAGMIHEEWMHSPGHRSNLMNPEVDRVGVAVVASRGVLYAVADYEHAVESLSVREIEGRVAGMIRGSGVAVIPDASVARAACATEEGIPRAANDARPGFVMRWQDSQLGQLPQPLAEKLTSGRYRRAAVGSCPAQGQEGTFSAYRIAVLLY
jgi:hypothetical protein